MFLISNYCKEKCSIEVNEIWGDCGCNWNVNAVGELQSK